MARSAITLESRWGGINLNIESDQNRQGQHALYNLASKYGNIKTQMASDFVRDLIRKEAGKIVAPSESLTESLKELFETFFPDKKFEGPLPTDDGRLLFPIRTASGATHDLNDLSSGEKEILLGYLRLRNTESCNSVLLIDEPELHLNPRLIQGLLAFYHEHLGRAFGNQLWLVTHSDAILRQALGRPGCRVFHMHSPGEPENESNQVKEITVAAELEAVVIDLVGDLAAYRPGGKLVIFEGGGDTEFDIRMTSQLFPDFVQQVNIISGGNKPRVRDFHQLLQKLRKDGQLPVECFSIVDRDSGDVLSDGSAFSWDAYHIENYLLVPAYILRVLLDLNIRNAEIADEDGVLGALRACAKQTLPSLINHDLQSMADAALIKCIRTKIKPDSDDAPKALRAAIASSMERLAEEDRRFSIQFLEKENSELRRAREAELAVDEWKTKFRGRDILKRFVGRYGDGVPYEKFRDLVVARMRDKMYQPPGMKLVLDKIRAATWDR